MTPLAIRDGRVDAHEVNADADHRLPCLGLRSGGLRRGENRRGRDDGDSTQPVHATPPTGTA